MTFSEWMFLYVLVEDIKDKFKTVQQHSHIFEPEIFGETLLRPQRMVAELRLTDPLLELAVGGILEPGVSRSESFFFESSRPSLLRVGLVSLFM